MRRVQLLMALLVQIFSLAACSPGQPEPLAAPIMDQNSPQSPTQSISQPVPQATSRGDKLMASKPGSVKYGDGSPVLVEFFRFT
jgi:predicted small lipoprotein YifL